MYDAIIIGAGPAGLTAGIYLARAGLKALILEKETIGGNIASSPLVENYPGIEKISGSELADHLYEQVTNLGVEIEIETVVSIEPGPVKKVKTENKMYEAKAIILATGSKYRMLHIEKEEELIGKGIHFCTLCDGTFYKDKVVAVIGGANSAVTNALYLADICKKVYILYRGDQLKCEKTLFDAVQKKDNVEILYQTEVTKLFGDDTLTGAEIVINGKTKEMALSGIFEAIGMLPATEIAPFLPLDTVRYFDSSDCKTDQAGIFVAGDCRSKQVRQLTTATSDGTIAAMAAMDYLKGETIC